MIPVVRVDFAGSRRGLFVHAFKNGCSSKLEIGDMVSAEDDDGTAIICKIVDDRPSHYVLRIDGQFER